jgi:flagellar motility protein MotE (MotC chaperone)
MKKLLTSSWMTVLVGAVVYVISTVLFWKTPRPVPISSRQTHRAPGTPMPSWDFVNPEADQLLVELHTQKDELNKREQQLNELALRLAAERNELNQVTQTVYQLRTDFDQSYLRVQSEETANLKKLAKVYAAMTPDSAATVLGQLDDTAIVKTMLFMKEADTAAIFESLAKQGPAQAKRAANLSERLRTSVFRNPVP